MIQVLLKWISLSIGTSSESKAKLWLEVRQIVCKRIPVKCSANAGKTSRFRLCVVLELVFSNRRPLTHSAGQRSNRSSSNSAIQFKNQNRLFNAMKIASHATI